MKFSGGDTAEGDAFKLFFVRQCKAGTVTGPQTATVFFRQPAVNNGADCVDDIPARQVKCRCDFCLSCRLDVPLLLHQLRTGTAELYTCIGVNCVVNAPVVRAETAEQGAVCCIDDGVAPECCNVALPQINVGQGGRKVG